MTDQPDGPDPAPEIALYAGAAAYNAGEYRAAHDIWAGADTALLDALAAFAETVADARAGEWDRAMNAVDRAAEALAAADPTERGVDTAPLQRWLGAFSADPERIERGPPPSLSVDGESPTAGVLSLAAAGVAARAVAEFSAYDDGVVADAVRFAERAEAPDESRFATFLRDFVGEPAQRAVVFQRLTGLVEQERRKERDVGGLFDEQSEE